MVKLLRAQVPFGSEKAVQDGLALPGDLELFLPQIGCKDSLLFGQISVRSHFGALGEGVLYGDWFGQDHDPAKYSISPERATTDPSLQRGCLVDKTGTPNPAIRPCEASGKTAAAELTRKLGSNAETNLELCYRLYARCECKVHTTKPFHSMLRCKPAANRPNGGSGIVA